MNTETPLTLAALRDRFNAGETFSFLYFWGHRPRADGRVSSSCFSQWFESPFELDGVPYASAEHFMMAEKARLFGDADTLARILSAETPMAAKAFGREVKDYEDAAWEAHRFDAVVKGNLAKFSQNAALGEFLRATGSQVLVEASPVDPVWGIGLSKDSPLSQDPNTWKGLNLLGFVLGAVRERLA
ncbi:MAG: hypothetical protein RLZZ618_1182 [Pseudomonadota bacterium]